ncbi:alpha/beta hydrolase [Nocardia flavorosea]|uniref:alpha/beta hydrolase n=1 Tax=Nocardia flavorosea TaxID=53429 RepID=UPI00245444F2|nr:alpha/beta hydrolase [Nocardia flavorosea]
MAPVRSGRCGVPAGVLAAVAILVAGCADEQEVATAPPAPVPAELSRFYEQVPQWESCAGYVAPGESLPPATQCARIEVPIDYADPDGPTAQLALSRLRATGSKIGSLLLNPGGPGMSGLSTATIGGGTPVAERFDRVGFDPRGVGASTPAVTCLTPQEADAERAETPEPNTPEGIAADEAENREYADLCMARTGADLLAHIGTREVVQDMDIIRAVLGDPKLNYLGYSYGTRLGTAYAEKFPGNVRALVLDGAIDPTQDPVAESLRQAAGFQQAFDTYAADCVKSADCPLGTDPGQVIPRFRELVDPLRDTPAATTDPRGLSYDDAITGVQQTLYSADFWPVLTVALTELSQGRGDTLLQLADMYNGRRDDGSYSNLTDAFNAIRCVDDPRVTDRAVAGRQDTEYRAAAPFLDDGRGTGAAPLELCAGWPVPNTGQPHEISVEGLPQTVVVSTTGDPATPYQAGVDLAGQLGAALITHEGDSHTVVFNGGATCVDDAVISYLVDLKSPPEGLRC